ncbi:DUF3995 domain-containing protein [Flavivirga rizhaonensis]|uniref:DUF3995 domain-containing protein n=1 Tax=Flavivirga rizhaonensis TaxID=2559571 RepID=UPI001477636F|nr:DUF3995 domain-containing protein [Flavivirga rizhaonensis]
MSFVFFVLGLIHLNWSIGGTFGFAESLPTKETGERVLNLKKFDSVVVGLGLMSFSFFYLLKVGYINLNLSDRLVYQFSFEITVIKHPFSPSTSIEKETVT